MIYTLAPSPLRIHTHHTLLHTTLDNLFPPHIASRIHFLTCIFFTHHFWHPSTYGLDRGLIYFSLFLFIFFFLSASYHGLGGFPIFTTA
jgi:hypothetical protein